jgi:excinuclease UvrABC helicase subunit UvrB
MSRTDSEKAVSRFRSRARNSAGAAKDKSPGTKRTASPLRLPYFATQAELDTYIAKLASDMREAGQPFEFEKAAKLRTTVKELRTKKFLFS